MARLPPLSPEGGASRYLNRTGQQPGHTTGPRYDKAMTATIHGIQFDTAGHLPFTPALQAFYVNGRFAHTPYSVGRGRVWIDVNGTAPNMAFWRDIEKGDGSPEGFGSWLDQRHTATGGPGGGYCDRSNLPAMLASAGRRPWSLWLATLDGTTDPALIPELARLPASVTLAAIQAVPAAMLGFPADMSVVLDPAYWDKHHA